MFVIAGGPPWHGAAHPHAPAGCNDAAGLDRADADAAQGIQGSEARFQHGDSVGLPREAQLRMH